MRAFTAVTNVVLQACLKTLMEMACVDLDIKDNLGRSAYVVASKRCKDFLNEIGMLF